MMGPRNVWMWVHFSMARYSSSFAIRTILPACPWIKSGGQSCGPTAQTSRPWTWDLNLRFAYDMGRWMPGARVRPRLLADVFHLFGQREAVNLDQVRCRRVDADGNCTSENATFGEVLAYQPPMTFRMGIETGF